MLLPSGNPFKCHEEVLYFQLLTHLLRAVLMGTKSCPKILNFSTRFSCENLDVEDFVTLLKGGSYGNKILYKNLKFFDKIFVPSKIS